MNECKDLLHVSKLEAHVPNRVKVEDNVRSLFSPINLKELVNKCVLKSSYYFGSHSLLQISAEDADNRGSKVVQTH